MSHHTTKFLRGVARCFYPWFPLVYLLLVALFFDVRASRIVSLLLEPYTYLVFTIALFAGYGLFNMRRWGWYVFLFAHLCIAILSADIAVNYASTSHPFLAFVVSLFLQAVLVYQVTREVRVPYFLPRIRWWEPNTSYQPALHVTVKESDTQRQYSGTIMDLAPRGCFVKTSEPAEEGSPIQLDFNIFGQRIECKGDVVWITESGVTTPKGIGIKFRGLNRAQKRRLKIASQRLQRIMRLYQRAKSKSEQDYLAMVLRQLEEQREGPAK